MKSVKIRGMSCQHCVMAVTRALESVEGIKNVSVDLQSQTATFEETKPVAPSLIVEAIKKAGYYVVE